MTIVFKTNQGSIRVTEKFLITCTVTTFLLLIAIVMAAEYQSTGVVMNATVGYTIAITPSSALSRGILFGSLTGGINNNMAQNDTTGTGNVTQYNITADSANTDTTDFWHYAPNMDKQGSSPTLLIGNVTHESNKTTPDKSSNVNMTNKADGAIALTTSWSRIGNGNCSTVAQGGSCWIAYWLDVPSGWSSGTYNTTYYYCGNATNGNTACS
jgi:ABC-type transport system involved in multi-copper enzyme maturation permease subunit